MQIYETIQRILGLSLEAKELTFVQVSLRGLIVFIVSLAMVRMGNRRFLSKMSAFDAIFAFILASMLARAVNGSAPFVSTLGAGFVLVGFHALIARIAFRFETFERLIKGTARALVVEGRINQKVLARESISENDLIEEARLNGQITEVNEIELATLERNGQVSIVRRN